MNPRLKLGGCSERREAPDSARETEVRKTEERNAGLPRGPSDSFLGGSRAAGREVCGTGSDAGPTVKAVESLGVQKGTRSLKEEGTTHVTREVGSEAEFKRQVPEVRTRIWFVLFCFCPTRSYGHRICPHGPCSPMASTDPLTQALPLPHRRSALGARWAKHRV